MVQCATIKFNDCKISYKTLSSALKEMQNDGLVHREEYPQIPPKVNYSLTEKGQTLWFRKSVNGESIRKNTEITGYLT